MIHRLFTYTDSNQVGELGISVDVHLHDTIADGSLDLVLRRTRSTVEDEEASKRRQRDLGRSQVIESYRGLVPFAPICSATYSWCLRRRSGSSLTFPGL